MELVSSQQLQPNGLHTACDQNHQLSPDVHAFSTGGHGNEPSFHGSRRHIHQPHLVTKENSVKSSWKEKLQKLAKTHVHCNKQCWSQFVPNHFPFVSMIRNYKVKQYLLNDIIAGLTVGIAHIPQGMAYSLLAGLPPIYGLYVSFFPSLIYFFLGTSRHMSLGTLAACSVLIGAAVDKHFVPSVANTNSTVLSDVSLDVVPTFVSDLSSSVIANDMQSSPVTHSVIHVVNDLETDPDLDMKVGIATSVTFLGGVIMIFLGICNFGFVAAYLSEPVFKGFNIGCSTVAFLNQFQKVLGVSLPRQSGNFKIVKDLISLAKSLGQTNIATVLLSIGVIIILIIVKDFVNPKLKSKFKINFPIPIDLIMVIVVTFISYMGQFENRFRVKVLGVVPRGLPSPQIPPLHNVGSLLEDAAVTAVVGFAVSISLGQMFAKKNNYKLNVSQEMIAIGSCNLIGSIFSCFACAASIARTTLQDALRGKTQVASLVSCSLILAVMFFMGPLLYHLPLTVLSCILMVTLKNIIKEFQDVIPLWRYSKFDVIVWVMTWAVAVFVDIPLGLVIGVSLSVMGTVWKTQWPKTLQLKQLAGSEVYADERYYEDGVSSSSKILILRFEAPIYFANAQNFQESMLAKVNTVTSYGGQSKTIYIPKPEEEEVKRGQMNFDDGATDKPVLEKPVAIEECHVTHVILDMSLVTFMDSTGLRALVQVRHELDIASINLLFAACHDAVIEFILKSKTLEANRDCFYLSVHDAVLDISQATMEHQASK
ncbi:hypothetical protein CHS0354_043181 [Potamilus streckersoni]|uniref:STAS domain-containing protein n=1 Tax=Potamilus streckersoni TaxID=2493646 RepID=A0AAE0VYR6_9BIVA|nr:hypothetical protein CHS0354_043181 [Potamilus streckersoni]